MRLIKPYYEILTQIDGNNILQLLELAGRTCYKSTDRMTQESAIRFCKNILNRNHESVIEHYSITIKFVVSRSFTHELVRHRLCSFSQESTRYVKYNSDNASSKHITFIIPLWFYKYIQPGMYEYGDITDIKDEAAQRWFASCLQDEENYNYLIAQGQKPEEAREVLPNCLKTEIITTANLREWRHIFKLRTAHAAHPQMREIMMPLCLEFQSKIPIIFDDIQP